MAAGASLFHQRIRTRRRVPKWRAPLSGTRFALTRSRGAVEFGRSRRKWVAPPGRSAGCAVDLWLGYSCSKENNEKIKQTQAYKWLTTNANDHGFNPYPLEGWHWEFYVGESPSFRTEHIDRLLHRRCGSQRLFGAARGGKGEIGDVVEATPSRGGGGSSWGCCRAVVASVAKVQGRGSQCVGRWDVYPARGFGRGLRRRVRQATSVRSRALGHRGGMWRRLRGGGRGRCVG